MRINLTEKYEKFYFIGIGGVSMSGLARYMILCGKKVGGYDAVDGRYVSGLRALGAAIAVGTEEDDLSGYDVYVYTDALPPCNERLTYARQSGKPVLSRGKFLYEVSRNFDKIIAVSGCHGKTTCTAMLAHIFYAAGKKFAAHIGGNDLGFLNFYYCGNDYLITEACEYKKNFLLIKPDTAVILNSAPDHLECYGSEEELKRAYLQFSSCADVAVTLYCDLPVKNSLSFGFDKNADYYATNMLGAGGRYSFCVHEGDCNLGTVSLNVFGKHNVLNALAAIAVARSCGISFRMIKEGLSQFCGVERRFEYIGEYNGAVCIADYAHHPDEIRANLRTAKKVTGGKIYVIFQPHTYSRTRLLFKQFVKVLSPLNGLMIYRTFAAREYFDDAGSALALSHSLKRSRYGDNPSDIVRFISSAQSGDCILFLGAGDIYDIAKEIAVMA